MSGGPPMSPDERRARDSARGRRSYEALLARFERDVDPDGTLYPAERARRAELARAEHFRELGRRGSAATADQLTQELLAEAPGSFQSVNMLGDFASGRQQPPTAYVPTESPVAQLLDPGSDGDDA